MNYFDKLWWQIWRYLAILMVILGGVITAIWWFGLQTFELEPYLIAIISLVACFITGAIFATFASQYVLSPLQFLWQAVLHVLPEHSGTPPPNIAEVHLGREMLTSLSLQIYQMASQERSSDTVDHRKQLIQASSVVNHMPIPLFVFNQQLLVTNASDTGMKYLGIESSKLFGKALFENVIMDFPSNRTLETWIKECQDGKVTDATSWERVRVHVVGGEQMRQCDVSAYYNRDNPSGTEFIVTLFDRTDKYDGDDDSLSFVALAVHELRTPLTMLRGYIEVIEEELSGKLTPELNDYMDKLQVAADRLNAFVNNILNITKIENDQMSLHLNEEKPEDLIHEGATYMQLRAKVHGVTIDYAIAPNLPTVAADRVSIYEVLNNLLDNALKYGSNGPKKINVMSKLRKDGMVEFTVQDFGVGIPNNVLPNLFEKFYRNHRTKAQIGGSGLGLYLCKSIVEAHGGQIWAESKQDSGSTFGFTLPTYASLAGGAKTGNNKDITRQAHGWIKNHSLYRR